MNQYTFSSKHRNVLLGAIIIGIISMVLTWMGDDANHTRFWTNFLHNSVFFTMISLMAAFFIAACITAYAGWHTTFKRVWEAYSMFLIVGLSLMAFLGLGVYMHWHHLYHWAVESDVANDAILKGKSSFLNKNWYFFGTLICGGAWFFIASKLRNLSISEDESGDSSYSHHKSMKVYAAIFLPIVGFTSAAMLWQWIMSIDAHWYSTMFAWYSTASAFVSMIALTIILIIFLKSNGYYPQVNENHIHDLGKFLFAISVFWTYLWFSQFMLIWYANIGEETIYFKERYNNYSYLFYGNIIINFVVPFLVLIRNDVKRKFGSVSFMAGVILVGHWIDYFLMIKPGALINAQHSAHGASHGDHGHGAEEGAAHSTEQAHAVVHSADTTHAVSETVAHAGDTTHAASHAVAHSTDTMHTAATHVAEAAHTAGHATDAHAAHASSTFVEGFTVPGLLEIGTFIGFLGLFFYVALTVLSKSALVPKNDPYLDESLHHQV
jgi:hypothetical protein